MSDTPPPAATSAPPAAQPTFLQRYSRWISVAAGVIIGLTLLLQLLLMFSLPGCGDKRATDTLHEIFRQQKVTIDRIRDFKLVSEGESDRTCSAVVRGARRDRQHHLPDLLGRLDGEGDDRGRAVEAGLIVTHLNTGSTMRR